MNERMIPASKVEKITDWLWEDMLANGGHVEEIAPQLAARAEMAGEVRRLLLALLPAPPRPTLADMTADERAECQWMQADVANRRLRYVIGNPFDDENEAALIDSDGDICWLSPDLVTPRPDLPRMTWPGTEKPDPAPALPDGWRLADHPDYGRVIVTTTPNSDGRVYYVLPSAGTMGNACDLCLPSELTYIDAEPGADTVPPNTLAEGSVWHDEDALTEAVRESGRDQIIVTHCDNNVSVWDGKREDWRILYPLQKYAPFTIIHAGKGGDQ